MSTKQMDASGDSTVTHAPLAQDATAVVAVAADDGQDDAVWRSQHVWADSGFLAFLAAHEIKRSDLLGDSNTSSSDNTEHRFFRMKQHGDGTTRDDADVIRLVTASLEREGITGVAPAPVPWLPSFFALPVATPLARIDLYRTGELYGIDISSGYAVTLLNIQPGEHVLDLCCAPGAKLTMIADLLRLRGSVTGVDYSRQRIGACKQLVHKYQLTHAARDGSSTRAATWRCRLFHADGRTFALGPMTECDAVDGVETVLDTDEIASRSVHTQQRKRMNKSARARMRKRHRVAQAIDVTSGDERTAAPQVLYDKVLVDAECTHDGSIRHLQKNDSLAKWRDYVSKHLSASELARILALQAALIRNGFALLRVGGEMVYSTCSLSVKQNEDIVAAFLAEHSSAALEPIARDGIPCEEGRLYGTVRFTPARNTSGLFIARIRKRASDETH